MAIIEIEDQNIEVKQSGWGFNYIKFLDTYEKDCVLMETLISLHDDSSNLWRALKIYDKNDKRFHNGVCIDYKTFEKILPFIQDWIERCHMSDTKNKIDKIYRTAIQKLRDKGVWGSDAIGILEYGPAHIVWGDKNFDSIQWCLDNIANYKDDYTPEQMEIVKWSLEELLKIPSELLELVSN